MTLMSFPSFPPSDLIQIIRDHGYQGDLSVEDLSKPSANKIVGLYEWFLHYLASISREDIRNAAAEPLLNIHHPEIYEYRLMAGAFKDVLDQIMRCAAIHDFSDRDLMAPTPERTRRLLSGLANFALFEGQQAEVALQPLEKSLEDLQTQRAQLLDREAELMEQISMMSQQHEDAKRAAAELKPQTENLKATILECKETEGPLDQRRTELTEARKAIAEQNREAVTELQRLKAEIRRLSQRVARSPEKVKSEIESLQKTLASELDTIASLEQNSRILEQKINANEKYEDDLGVCIKLQDEWEIEISRAAEVRKEVGILTDQCDTRLPELQEVEKKSSQSQRRIELLEEQLERAHTGIQRKKQAAKERHVKLLERQEAALEAQAEHEREMEQQLNLKAHLASQIDNMVEDYTRGMKKGQAIYDTIRAEVVNFTMKHQAAISAIEAKLPLPLEDR